MLPSLGKKAVDHSALAGGHLQEGASNEGVRTGTSGLNKALHCAQAGSNPRGAARTPPLPHSWLQGMSRPGGSAHLAAVRLALLGACAVHVRHQLNAFSLRIMTTTWVTAQLNRLHSNCPRGAAPAAARLRGTC